jgi:hypothetical protein
MKQEWHIFSGFLVMVVMALLLSAIPAAVQRNRCTQDMTTLSGIAKKMTVMSIDNGEKYPDVLTNKSFLASLTPPERTFLTENKVDMTAFANTVPITSSSPADTVLLRVRTKRGKLSLFVDGSIRRDEQDSLMRISWLAVVAAALAIIATYRWIRTRYLLYRMTEKMDELLKLEGVDTLNFFKPRKLRRLLSLTQLAVRLRQRIDRLLEHHQKAQHKE